MGISFVKWRLIITSKTYLWIHVNIFAYCICSVALFYPHANWQTVSAHMQSMVFKDKAIYAMCLYFLPLVWLWWTLVTRIHMAFLLQMAFFTFCLIATAGQLRTLAFTGTFWSCHWMPVLSTCSQWFLNHASECYCDLSESCYDQPWRRKRRKYRLSVQTTVMGERVKQILVKEREGHKQQN